MFIQFLLRGVFTAMLVAAFAACAFPASPALAQSTFASALGDAAELEHIVSDLGKPSGDIAKLSGRQRALLFKHNDLINAARTNGEISNTVFQAAQGDFAQTNRRFAADAAADAGAEFTVQQRTSSTYSPGTDSDYITVVQNKEQIADMQKGYNERINKYLNDNGIPEQSGSKWHNKLDTDFMADPRYVTEAEFREIAKLNNDAYKRRHAAEFEKIKRAGGGKIGPQHVTATAEEMADFSTKKGAKIQEMFKDPSQFGDPVKRAEVFRAMAQEQKYITRIEELEDFLRAQEGLPPRQRGTSIAAQGAIRSPDNVRAIRDAHALAEQTRTKSLQDLIETMSEIKNPEFRATAADDIVKIMQKLPPGERATAMGILKTRNAGLARQVDAAIDSLPRTSGTSALDDVAKAGKMRQGLQAAADAMEALGKVAAAADVLAAASQLKDYFDTMRKALDPATSEAEAQALFEKAQEIAAALAESSALVAIMERHPAVAIAYGSWTLLCMGGEWISSNRFDEEFASRPAADGSCLDRQMSAWDRFSDWWSGKEAADEKHKREICARFKEALGDGRLKLRESWTEDFLSGEQAVDHACWRLANGESLSDMLDTARIAAALPSPAPTPETKTTGIDCDLAQVAKSKPDSRKGFVPVEYKGATAWTGGQNPDCPAFGPAAKDVADGAGGETKRKADADAEKRKADEAKQAADAAKLKADEAQRAAARVAQACSNAAAALDRGREHYLGGRIAEYRIALTDAERELEQLNDSSACADERAKIAKGAGQADLLENVIKAADQALKDCNETQLQKLSGLLSKTNHPFVAQLRSRTDRMARVANQVGRADAAYTGGRVDSAAALYREAAANLNAEPGACPSLASRVRDAQERARTGSLGNEPLTAKLNDCKARLGVYGIAIHDANSLSGYRCDCKQPYRLDSSACVRAKTESELAAERAASCGNGYQPGPVDAVGNYKCLPSKETADAGCRQANPTVPGVYAGPIKNDGTYSCLPTKQAANAWCRENGGPGVVAGRINTDGSYKCVLTQAGANTRCQQANPGMSGIYASQIKTDGSFTCLRSQPTVSRTPQPQPQHDAASSAAAAAVAGAVIQGVIGAINRRQQRDTRGPSTHTQPQPTYRPPTQTGRPCNTHNPINSNVGCY